VNGQVTGAEVYASNALFRKAWPKLLNSAAVEAVAELTDKPSAAPPSVREVEYFLARGATPANRAGSPGVRGVPDQNLTNEELDAAFREVQVEVNRIRTVTDRQENLRAARPEARTERSALQRVGGQPDPNPAPTDGFVNPRDAVADSIAIGGSGRAPAQPAAPVNPNGNRLNSNRTENASTLMVESRDPTRQNAVIHRSYLKK
jgi:hypothetical protein